MTTASNKVLALFGPTASGKTELLSRLFLDTDRPFPRPVVVVSADSVQVYRGLDIGAAKPDAGLKARLPHRLIDIREPSEPISVGDYVGLADAACEEAIRSGALPVLSGGTAFYIKAFILGLPSAPVADVRVRAELEAELATRGQALLRAELERVDPVSAARIKPNDTYRLTRALEVYRSSGRPLSSYALPDRPRARWDVLPLAIDRPRAELYARVEQRVDAMVKAGLADELRALVAKGYGPEDPGMRAIGYAEFFELGGGDVERGLARMDEAVGLVKLRTRRYAKRQLTFMRALPGVEWFSADDLPGVRARILAWLG